MKDGEYIEGKFLFADGSLTHVKKKRQVDNYTLYIGKIKGKNVISDGVYFAHCDSLRNGIEDLQFKRAKERGKEQYNNLTYESVVSTEEAVRMYRILTSACRLGVQNFMNSLTEVKKQYTVREIIELTKGQYGAERLGSFFEAQTNSK